MTNAFNQSARSSLVFLEKDYGFRVVEDRPNYLRLESDWVVVVAFYDQMRSFEADLEIGLRSHPERRFDSGEFFRSRAVMQAEWPSGYQVKTPQAVTGLIQQLASLLQRYGDDLLRGESNAWDSLDAQRRTECLDYAQVLDLKHAFFDANAAWDKRDFVGVVKALSQWQEHLDGTDLKRFEYAKRKLKENEKA